MERNIVFTHELNIANVLCAFIEAPPGSPVAHFTLRCFTCPGFRCRDIGDGRIEPDVKNFIFKPGARRPVLENFDAPIKIARD